MNKRYFFDRDGDGHWYMLPYDKRGEWSQWIDDYPDNDDYSDYRLPGGISEISFQNPEDIVPEEKIIKEKLKNFDVFLMESTENNDRKIKIKYTEGWDE